MTATRFWTPQADDVVFYGEDEDAAVVWADLRDEADAESRVDDGCMCGSTLAPCQCHYGEDEGDGYAAGGWDMGDQWE